MHHASASTMKTCLRVILRSESAQVSKNVGLRLYGRWFRICRNHGGPKTGRQYRGYDEAPEHREDPSTYPITYPATIPSNKIKKRPRLCALSRINMSSFSIFFRYLFIEFSMSLQTLLYHVVSLKQERKQSSFAMELRSSKEIRSCTALTVSSWFSLTFRLFIFLVQFFSFFSVKRHISISLLIHFSSFSFFLYLTCFQCYYGHVVCNFVVP